MLGKYQGSIGDDIEDALDTSDEFGLHSEFRGDVGPQTGGLRQIVSTYAVGYGDTHRGPWNSLVSIQGDGRNAVLSAGIVLRSRRRAQ